MDIVTGIFLLAMGDLGIAAALLTCALLLIIRTVGIHYPDTFVSCSLEEKITK